jgi:hypothetical protein
MSPGGWSGLGSIEVVVGRALLDLQSGDVGGAVTALRAAATGAGAESGFVHSALALALAADGDATGARAAVEAVDSLPRSTYLDRATADLADALVRAAAGEEAAVGRFTELVAAVDETEDRCAQAIVRLGEALALDVLGLPTAEWALDEAERRLDELDIEPSGWRVVFARALAADKAPADV